MSKVACYNACTVKPGQRDAYLNACEEQGLLEAFKAQPGCLYYHVSLDTLNPDVVILNDGWEDEAAFEGHAGSKECQVWYKIADEFIVGQAPVVSHFD